MSRLDFFTIFVVALCIIAIVFLIFQATQLANGTEESTISNEVATGFEDENTAEDDEDIYDYEDDDYDAANAVTDDVADDELEGEPTTDDEISTEEATSFEEESTPEPLEDTSDEIINPHENLGKYLVIAGAFKIKANAENYARQMRRDGYPSAAAKIFDRGSIAVVLVDRFSDYNDAQRLVGELKAKGIEAYTQNVRNR